MDAIRIIGGNALNGTIRISGAKNAALPLMTATLLTDEPVTLSRVPHLMDITSMANLLTQLGAGLSMSEAHKDIAHGIGHVLTLHTPEITSITAPYELVRKMRASVLVLGPLLARKGEAVVSLPGGCAIGSRPIDQHLKGFEAMGAEIVLEEGYVHAKAPNGLKGGEIQFDMVSVGATENLLMAATLADGVTVMRNAAREPEISDLAHCLIAMGAEIEGIDTSTLTITGKPRLHGANHAVVADRIEAGSYAIAAAITGGDILLQGASYTHLAALAEKLHEAGVGVTEAEGGVQVRAKDVRVRSANAITQPFPGFPTDMQAQYMTLMTLAEGTSVITETIFENRFMHVPELMRMGAWITHHGNTATVSGVEKLKGAPVMATDLRASMSLVLAGLAAEGETLVNRIYHLDRGYERLEEKLSAVGADIQRVAGE